MYRLNRIWNWALLLVAVAPGAYAQTSPETWQADLRFLVQRLETGHANLFHDVDRATFYDAVAQLEQRIPDLADHQIIIEIARLLARVQDGHTTAGLAFDILRPTTGFRKYPLRIAPFEEGFFVVQTAAAHEALLGQQLIAIGGHPVSDVFEAVSPLLSRSKRNASLLKWQAPELMVTAEVLHALGLIDMMEATEFSFGTARAPQTATLAPLAIEKRPFTGQAPQSIAPVEWKRVADQLTPRPLFQQKRDRPFWYTYLEPNQTVYLQFNQVRNAPDETFEAFCERLFAFIDTHAVAKLVIDLRFNQGGDGTLNWALIERIRTRPMLNTNGKVFALIGPQTFSAAMMAAVALERYTETLFVGEPTGASPNHYGDTGFVVLPNSGMALIHSEIYWQLSDPDDERPWIAPDIPVASSFSAFQRGEDPALEAILAYDP